MKSAPSEPSDLVIRLRQQLILAQVRIMELEDERDGLLPRLAELDRLLSQAQALADQKTGEASHLSGVLGGLQAQHDQLHQAQLRAAQELATARAAHADATARLGGLESSLAQATAELQAVKSSRSWRWTAWLRAPGGKSGDA